MIKQFTNHDQLNCEGFLAEIKTKHIEKMKAYKKVENMRGLCNQGIISLTGSWLQDSKD